MDAYLSANPNYFDDKAKEAKREVAAFDDSNWKGMDLPQSIEAAGLDIDGIVWFRKEINLSALSNKATLSLGAINESDVTYINGIKVGGMEFKPTEKRLYLMGSGILKAGKNVIAIRMTDTRGRGGFVGTPEEMFLQIGGRKMALAGNWKYEVEKVFTDRQSMFEGTTIGKLFVDTNLDKREQPQASVSADGTTVIKLSAIKNEMKYDLKTFTVEAGKPIEIIFTNPDFMQHNLVVGQIGSLEKIGEAANKLAADPKGAQKNYVPEVPEVLFYTKLVNPQQTVSLKFTAPAKVGDYPYICTFPGHWSIMNGIMKVVAAKPL
jgi:azurin